MKIMEKKHINEILEEKVNGIFLAAREEALNEFAIIITAKLPHLDLFHQLKLLMEEFDRLELLEQASEHPYYIHNHAALTNLLNQFSSRAFLLNLDESNILFDCIKLGKLKLEVYTKFEITARAIPQYSFEDFMNGVPNTFLFELGITKFFDELELHKIMKWQEETLIEIVDRETSLVIKNLQRQCGSIANPEEFLKGELDKINLIKEESKTDIDGIKNRIFNLYSFKGLKNNNWDAKILLYYYEKYIQDRCGHKFISPSNVGNITGKKRQKKSVILVNEITIFYVIQKFRNWLINVIEKKSWNDPYLIFNWKDQLEKKLIEIKAKIETKTKEIDIELINTPENKKEQMLFKYFNFYRVSFNNFQFKRYFEFWTGITADLYLRKFTTYGYYEADPLNQIKLIGEAIYIQKMAWRTNRKFLEVAQDHFYDYIDMEEFTNEIPVILSHMVYDKVFYVNTQLFDNPFMDEIWHYGLPKEMMEFNCRDHLEDYLEGVLNKLEVFLKEAEQNKGILYLQSRLKQMRLRNLDYRKNRFTEQRHKIQTKYSDRFKEYLEIEAEFLKETKDIPAINNTYNLKTKVENFETIFPNEKAGIVINLLEDLKLTVNGIVKISPRGKSALRGIAEALINANIAPKLSLETIYMAIAQKINLEIRSKLDESAISRDYRKKATAYLKDS